MKDTEAGRGQTAHDRRYRADQCRGHTDRTADGTQGALWEEVLLAAPRDGTYTVLVHRLNDRGSLAEVAATLTLLRDGDEVSLPLNSETLVQGEVWQAFSVAVPGGEAMIDQIVTHESLGGPELNRAVTDG